MHLGRFDPIVYNKHKSLFFFVLQPDIRFYWYALYGGENGTEETKYKCQISIPF